MSVAVEEPVSWMPAWRFPEMTLPGPVPGAVVTPPMVVPEALSISTPLWTLPTPDETPVASRPIRLPRIWLLSALVGGSKGSEFVTLTPDPRLPEMTLPAPAAVPPTTLPAALSTTPSPRLGSVAVPLAVRPIRLPRTSLPVDVSWMSMPFCALPEMRLAADPSRLAAPMVLFEAPSLDQNSVLAVGKRTGAREVGADPVADHQVAGREGVVELQAVATDCQRSGCR